MTKIRQRGESRRAGSVEVGSGLEWAVRTLLFAACIFLAGVLGGLVYRNLAEPPPAERPSAACLGATS